MNNKRNLSTLQHELTIDVAKEIGRFGSTKSWLMAVNARMTSIREAQSYQVLELRVVSCAVTNRWRQIITKLNRIVLRV